MRVCTYDRTIPIVLYHTNIDESGKVVYGIESYLPTTLSKLLTPMQQPILTNPFDKMTIQITLSSPKIYLYNVQSPTLTLVQISRTLRAIIVIRGPQTFQAKSARSRKLLTFGIAAADLIGQLPTILADPAGTLRFRIYSTPIPRPFKDISVYVLRTIVGHPTYAYETTKSSNVLSLQKTLIHTDDLKPRLLWDGLFEPNPKIPPPRTFAPPSRASSSSSARSTNMNNSKT